jgi:lysophospholipase L1-like esterase
MMLSQDAVAATMEGVTKTLVPPKVAKRLVGLRTFNHATGRAGLTDIAFIGYHTLTEQVDNLRLYYSNFHMNASTGGRWWESVGTPNTISASVREYDYVSANRFGPYFHTRQFAPSTQIPPRSVIAFDRFDTGPLLPGVNRLEIVTRVQCLATDNVPTGTGTASAQYTADGGGGAAYAALHPSGTNGLIYCPSAIVTEVPGGLDMGSLNLGDSYDSGTGSSDALGWFTSTLETAGIGCIVAARSGEAAADFVQYFRSSGRVKLAGLVPHALCGWVVNDVSLGQTFEQIRANHLTIWGWLKRAGVREITIKTCVPYTTAANNYIDLAGQTRVWDEPKRAAAKAWNAWARSPSGALADAEALGLELSVVDAHKLFAVNANNEPDLEGEFWRTNGTPNWLTYDGLHVGPLGHSLLGGELGPHLARWKKGFLPC